jgi:hypothetical protein
MKPKFYLSVALLTSLALLSGCHDNNDSGAPPPPAAVAPSITSQPSDQSITAGQPASFSVTASGTAPLSYQWQRDGVAISGATNSSYALSSTAATDSGAKFIVVVSNSAGSVTSNAATLAVIPAGQMVGAAGGTVASSDKKISVNIASGALKGDTYFNIVAKDTLTGLPSAYVLVSGTAFEIDWSGAGFTSEADATLSIANPTSGQVHVIRMSVRGVQPLDSSSPTSAVVQCGDTNNVYATSTDANASDYSDASVVLCSPADGSSGTSSTNVGLMQPGPGQFPAITSQPADVSDTIGDTATFSVVAAPASNVTYQWQRDGVDIAGAVTSSYSLVVAASDSGAKFSVVVSNALGSVTSREATLTVGQPVKPAAPQWASPITQTNFAPGIDLPQVGSIAGVNILAWNNNGVLNSDDATIKGRALPIRSRPKVLTGPNFSLGYIVFVDDDGTSSCQTGSGNRLSAIAMGWTYDQGIFPPSDRFTLYQSASDCIVSFAAAMAGDAVNKLPAVAFALQLQSAAGIQVGVGGAYSPGTTVGGVVQPGWTPSTPIVGALAVSADCASGFLTADGMMGILQAPNPVTSTSTAVVATLAFVAFANSTPEVCAASFSGTAWSSASMVFNNADQAEPVVAIDGSGNSLVFGSQTIDPSVPSYAMTAGYRAAGATSWQVQGLDTRGGAALASAAFDASGNAFVVWRPNLSGGNSIVYGTRLSAGAWETPAVLSAATAVDTRFPRVSVDPDGRALLLFEQKFSPGDPFNVYSKLWKRGLWSDISAVQNDANEGRFADCPRNANLSENLEIAWLETDPADATQFRVMSSFVQLGP